MAHFSQRIFARRNRLGMTQHDLATAADVSPTAVSAWERGLNEPTGRMVERVAQALKVSPAWLMGGPHADELNRANQMKDSAGTFYSPISDLRTRDLVARLAAMPPEARTIAFDKIDHALKQVMELFSPPPFPNDQPDPAVMAVADQLQPVAIQEAIDRAQVEQPTLDRAELGGGAGRYPAPRRQRQGGGP